MTTGRINQVTISLMQVGFTLLYNTKYSPLTRLSQVGVYYKAIKICPHNEVSLNPSQ